MPVTPVFMGVAAPPCSGACSPSFSTVRPAAAVRLSLAFVALCADTPASSPPLRLISRPSYPDAASSYPGVHRWARIFQVDALSTFFLFVINLGWCGAEPLPPRLQLARGPARRVPSFLPLPSSPTWTFVLVTTTPSPSCGLKVVQSLASSALVVAHDRDRNIPARGCTSSS